MVNKNFIYFFENALNFFKKVNVKAYLVGGFVRDLITFKDFNSNDIDFTVQGDSKFIANEFVKVYGGKVKIFDAFLTAKVIDISSLDGIEQIDFASIRQEVYIKPGVFPKVRMASSIIQDLSRRDFSVNALAISLEDLIKSFDNDSIDFNILKESVIDEFHGLDDLDKRIIRVLHEKSFYDDPTRIYRAFKYKERINGSFDNETYKLMNQAINDNVLSTVSKNRILKEIEKIKKEINGDKILEELNKVLI